MDARALARQGYTYAEIGRLLGRDWRTVKRYLDSGAQPVDRRRRMPSKLDEFKPPIDQWLAATPGLLATRIHQDLARDYGFEGSYNTVRRYVERSRPRPAPRQEERFETAPGHQAQVDWSHEQPIQTSSGVELPLYCLLVQRSLVKLRVQGFGSRWAARRPPRCDRAPAVALCHPQGGPKGRARSA